MINLDKREGKLQHIKFSYALHYTHLLVVDDVILFGVGLVEEWTIFAEIINFFCVAT